MAENSDTIALIIALERYQKGVAGLNGVDYSRNDANEFRKILISNFGLSEDQIHTYFDDQATYTTLSNDLPYLLAQTPTGGTIYLYYAGHGWHIDGVNRLSTFDSRLDNLLTSTLSVQEHILKPLQKSNCKRCLLFFDCCAVYPKGQLPRESLRNMDDMEFKNFVESNEAIAAFFACKPGERSYSSPKLQHGIWSHHLFSALRGEVKEAFDRQLIITGNSLQGYLAQCVPRFITSSTTIREKQTPWAEVKQTGPFNVISFPEDVVELSDFEKSISIKYDRVEFVQEDSQKVTLLSGFIKGSHKKPTHSCSGFISKCAENEIKEELKSVYDNAKDVFKIKRSKNISKSVGDCGGSVDCEYFRYYLDLRQGRPDFDIVYFMRRLEPCTGFFDHLENVDNIFPVSFKMLTFPVEGEIEHAEMVDKLEAIAERTGGNVDNDENDGWIEYTDNTLTITLRSGQLVVNTKGKGIRSVVNDLIKAPSILIGVRQMTKVS